MSGFAPLESDSGGVPADHESGRPLSERFSRVRRDRQFEHRQQAQMNLRLHERARDADVRQASGPDFGARHEADWYVRRLSSPPSMFHDDPGMRRPDGEGPLGSTVPPFHATGVTLSSSSGDRLSRIGTPSSGSGLRGCIHVALHCIRRGDRRIDEPKSMPLTHEEQIAIEMRISTTRRSHSAHVMRFSKAQPRAVSKVTIAALLHSAQWRPGVVRCSSAQFADPHCRAT